MADAKIEIKFAEKYEAEEARIKEIVEFGAKTAKILRRSGLFNNDDDMTIFWATVKSVFRSLI